MRDINRIDEFLERLKKIWKLNPDLRFNQLVLNVFNSPASYYMEDDKSIKRLEDFYYGISFTTNEK